MADDALVEVSRYEFHADEYLKVRYKGEQLDIDPKKYENQEQIYEHIANWRVSVDEMEYLTDDGTVQKLYKGL